MRKKLSRRQLLRYTGTLRACLIGMEAGAGAHYLGRRLLAQGHDVRLMPAQYVRPYVKSSKIELLRRLDRYRAHGQTVVVRADAAFALPAL